MTAASTPSPSPDRRERDARIRSLDKQGWSLARIAGEVGLTPQRVHQILSVKDAAALLDDHEGKLQAELEELLRHVELNRRRIRAVRRSLDRIAEEREEERIDRLLGLS